jgi:hypothetical protein
MKTIKKISLTETIKDLEICISQTQDELNTRLFAGALNDGKVFRVSNELMQSHIELLSIAKANLESVLETGGVDETYTLKYE